MGYKSRIQENVRLCTEDLIELTSQELSSSGVQMSRMLRLQTCLTILFLLVVFALVIFITTQIRIPLTRMVERMREQQAVPPAGASELRFATETYNQILRENQRTHQQLTYDASHDALTGLYNRSAYDMFMESMNRDHTALLLVDVDEFKTVNDTYGHDVGDRVLKRVAELLNQSFRSVDVICRLGGDEFVVLMTRVDPSLAQLVKDKVHTANELLQNPGDGLPKTSLSVGVAFSQDVGKDGDIFKAADSALYKVKERGRKGCEVYKH